MYVPFFACDALYDPFINLNIKYEYYSINENLEIDSSIDLKNDEYILYTNFFGIKTKYTHTLIDRYADKIIVDDTHNYFFHGYENNFSFTSARKYFGVPDGAFLLSPKKISINAERNKNATVDHNISRLLGKNDVAHSQFRIYEDRLNDDIEYISILSEKLLSLIDYEKVIYKRKENFNYLHKKLKEYNSLQLNIDDSQTYFCYPFLPKKRIKREQFYSSKIFIPYLWIDLIHRDISGFDCDKNFALNLLPLPIDHRYSIEDMNLLIDKIGKEL